MTRKIDDADSNNAENNSNRKDTFIGVALCYIAAFLQLGNNTVVKKMELHVQDALMIHALIQTVVCLIILSKNGSNLWIWESDDGKSVQKIRVLFILAAMLLSLAMSGSLGAISFMPIGDAMTIILCSAVPTVVLAAIFCGERLRLCKLICTVLVVIGIILIIRPPFLFKNALANVRNKPPKLCNDTLQNHCTNGDNHNYYYFGALSAIICMLCAATSRIVITFIQNNKSSKSPALLLFYQGILCFITITVLYFIGSIQSLLFLGDRASTYSEWSCFALCFYGVIGVIQFYLRLRSMKLAGPVVVGFVRTSEIIVSYVVEIILFQTVPHLLVIFGSMLIKIACIGVLFENTFLELLPRRLRCIF